MSVEAPSVEAPEKMIYAEAYDLPTKHGEASETPLTLEEKRVAQESAYLFVSNLVSQEFQEEIDYAIRTPDRTNFGNKSKVSARDILRAYRDFQNRSIHEGFEELLKDNAGLPEGEMTTERLNPRKNLIQLDHELRRFLVEQYGMSWEETKSYAGRFIVERMNILKERDAQEKKDKKDKISESGRVSFLSESNKQYPEWETKKLGEVSGFGIGFTPSTSDPSLWEGDNEWLSITGMNEKYLSKGTKRISDEAIKGKNPFPAGTLVMSFKLSVGKMAILNVPMFTNEAICGFSPHENLMRDYLYQYIEQADLVGGGERAVKGITLNKKKIANVPVALPSLPEQKKIAGFLGALDDRITQQEKLVSLLEQQKTAYSQRIFNRSLRFQDENGQDYPEWEEKKLGEVADWHNGYAFKPQDLANEGTTVVKIREMLDPNDLSIRTLKEGIPENNIINNGDILFSWSMTIASREWKHGRAYLNQHLYKVVPKEGVISGYLLSFLNADNRKLSSLAHGGTAKHITRPTLMKHSIPLPSLPEQEKIASFLGSLDEQVKQEKSLLESLKNEKKSYSQKIFGV